MKHFKLAGALVLLCLLCNMRLAFCQTTSFSKNSLNFGVGLGINEGDREIGAGPLYVLGYQRDFWNGRARFNPYLMVGGFSSIGALDVRDQYYRLSTLGVKGNFDVLKYKAFSFTLGLGTFLNYSRGLLGTGGDDPVYQSDSQYFFKLYYGGSLSAGFRLNPPKSRLAYELIPVNVYLGSDEFILGFLKVGVSVKLNTPAASEQQ